MTGGRKGGAQSDNRPRSVDLLDRADGRVDVFFNAHVYPEGWNGVKDYDVSIMIVRGIDPTDYGGREGLEQHVLTNWDAWKEMAEVIWL